MAEHGIDERLIGVSFDGTGLGLDGAIWGGEFLVGDYLGFRRAGHLRYVAMPGGDQAIREPWRMAYAHQLDAGADTSAIENRQLRVALRAVEQMIRRRFNTPMTSSAGRLFDAVASLVGLRDRVSHEGQAAIELEWLATRGDAEEGYPFTVSGETPHVVDTRPIVRGVVADVAAGVGARDIARRFHTTMAEMIVAVCDRIRQDTNLEKVVISGGVFLNVLLTREVMDRLGAKGFGVYRHRLVPPGDGGLSLGQLAVAARTLQARGERHPGNQRKSDVSGHTG
jgi:hydrogenase maturation protein HypF